MYINIYIYIFIWFSPAGPPLSPQITLPTRPPCGGGVGFTVGMGSPRPPCGVAWGLLFVDGVNSIIIITTNSKSLQTNENLENQGTPQ